MPDELEFGEQLSDTGYGVRFGGERRGKDRRLGERGPSPAGAAGNGAAPGFARCCSRPRRWPRATVSGRRQRR